ncbi:MAG: UbiA family prenyltransferase, partial [Gemmatimonadota bacterium]|nr:UbiA family prenyltransferase [Gemmatimonadota bacterium]
MLQLIHAMRPREWVKNVFVLAALVFTKRIFEPSDLLQGSLAFLCFCLISGAAYLFNDIRDKENDHQHPLKRNRPIASGALRVSVAAIAAVLLALTALIGGFYVHPHFGIVLLI